MAVGVEQIFPTVMIQIYNPRTPTISQPLWLDQLRFVGYFFEKEIPTVSIQRAVIVREMIGESVHLAVVVVM